VISVALCTYNGEKFLREQLDSIAQQTLLPDELVVCDDRSSDNTIAILEEFKQRAPFPVRIHLNETNLGSNRNFEKAISLCAGEIIALCDQDDVWKPRKLESLHSALEANPEAGYAFSDADLVDEHTRPLGSRLWESYGFRGKFKKLFFKGEQFRCLARKNIVTGATMAFRAALKEIAIPLPREGYWVHDEWIALIATALGKPGIPLDEVLISYRLHPKQQIGIPDKPSGQSLLSMYRRERERGQQARMALWERYCRKILKLEEILQKRQQKDDGLILRHHLVFLQEYAAYVLTRKEIMATRNIRRYFLILREAFSGRYARFANSWRTMVRDLVF